MSVQIHHVGEAKHQKHILLTAADRTAGSVAAWRRGIRYIANLENIIDTADSRSESTLLFIPEGDNFNIHEPQKGVLAEKAY